MTLHKAAGAGGVRGNRVTLECHRLSGFKFKPIWGDNEGRGSLACCSPWGRKESDTTVRLNNSTWDALAGSGRGDRCPWRGRGGVRTGAGLRSQRSQVLAEKLYRTRSPSARLRSWPVERRTVSGPGYRLPGLQIPDSDHMPSAHLRKQPAAPVGTGRPRLPRYGQRRRGPRHSRCATSQPPGSPTGAGHRHVPGNQAHSGTVPGAGGKGTHRQGQTDRQGTETRARVRQAEHKVRRKEMNTKGEDGKTERQGERQEQDRAADRGRDRHRDTTRGRQRSGEKKSDQQRKEKEKDPERKTRTDRQTGWRKRRRR